MLIVLFFFLFFFCDVFYAAFLSFHLRFFVILLTGYFGKFCFESEIHFCFVYY